jgi:hypothetical protein
MSDSYVPGSVEFGEPATYGGRKRICVSVRREDYNFSHTVLHLVKEKSGRWGWTVVMPKKTMPAGSSWTVAPERKLCCPISLRMAKAKSTWLIMAAGNDDRLESLRAAETVPEWAAISDAKPPHNGSHP